MWFNVRQALTIMLAVIFLAMSSWHAAMAMPACDHGAATHRAMSHPPCHHAIAPAHHATLVKNLADCCGTISCLNASLLPARLTIGAMPVHYARVVYWLPPPRACGVVCVPGRRPPRRV